jgi:predicted sulfurtransferase
MQFILTPGVRALCRPTRVGSRVLVADFAKVEALSEDLADGSRDGALLIDVREDAEVDLGTIPGATHIPSCVCLKVLVLFFFSLF